MINYGKDSDYSANSKRPQGSFWLKTPPNHAFCPWNSRKLKKNDYLCSQKAATLCGTRRKYRNDYIFARHRISEFIKNSVNDFAGKEHITRIDYGK